MRCTQPYGLSPAARAFLHEQGLRDDPCSHCGRDSGYVKEKYGNVPGAGDLPLFRYTLKDGSVAEEFVQCEIWSSGPMIWTALRLADGRELLWPEEELVE